MVLCKAFLTESGKVLKVTGDKDEALFANRLSKKPWTKSIINYYNAESITNFCNENNLYLSYYYVLLMDRVESFYGEEDRFGF